MLRIITQNSPVRSPHPGSLASLDSSADRWHFSDNAAISQLLLRPRAVPEILRVLERTWRGFDQANVAAAIFALNRALNRPEITKFECAKQTRMLRDNEKGWSNVLDRFGIL